MPKMEVTIPTDLIRKLERMGSQGEDIGKKMLKSGAKILYTEVDKNLKKNLYTNRKPSRHYPTGALEKSLTIDKPKKDKNGNQYISLYFKGKDSRGTSNNLKATVMEHGSSKQRKKPFVRPAVEKTKEPVNAEMQRIFEQENEKL
jgi:HK97 gp10 family phage protein